MSNFAPGVNPQLLRWARERAGYSLVDVAQAMGKGPELVELWETGKAVPTYNQLEKLAYSLYKRPIALFFFAEPPEEPDPRESFRTLPGFEIDSLLPDTRHAIRQGQAFQLSLVELTGGLNLAPRKIFQDVVLSPQEDVTHAAVAVRNYLRVPLAEQFKWPSSEKALEIWREHVQEVGIFVFKRAFKQEDVSGFSLADGQFPLIFLNNSTAKARQAFTLFHELAHILVGTSSITKRSDAYVRDLAGTSRTIEVFCNSLTAEILVPSYDFETRLSDTTDVRDQVEPLARLYKVSREVILRKLLDRQAIDPFYYEATVNQWIQEFKRSRQVRSPGGDYYATQASYLGEPYLGLAFTKYYQGAIAIDQLASHLNIKAKSVPGLEQAFLKKAAAR